MARAPNPYRADAGQYSGIGEGIGNLANAFLNSQPDPVDSARAQALAWQGRESRQKVQDLSDASRGRQDIGAMFMRDGGYNPDTDMSQVMGLGLGSGAFDGGGLGEVLLAANANLGGTDDQTLRSVIGAGGSVDKNNAFSMGGQQDLADRDFGYDQSLQGQQDAAAMQRLQATLSNNLERERIKGASGGSGAGGDGGVDWLAATRRGTVEGDAETAINDLVEDAGLSPSDVPPQLRQSLLDGAVRLSGQNLSPRAAVARLWNEYNVTPGQEGGLMGFFQDDVLNFEIPQSPSGGGGGPTPGTVEDGFEFLGGNPADPNNWRAVQ